MSANGNVLAVSATKNILLYQQYALIYRRSGSTWNLDNVFPTFTWYISTDQSVDISPDSNTVIIRMTINCRFLYHLMNRHIVCRDVCSIIMDYVFPNDRHKKLAIDYLKGKPASSRRELLSHFFFQN